MNSINQTQFYETRLHQGRFHIFLNIVFVLVYN